MDKKQDDAWEEELKKEQERELMEDRFMEKAERIVAPIMIVAAVGLGGVLFISLFKSMEVLGFYTIAVVVVCTMLILRKLNKLIQLLDKK